MSRLLTIPATGFGRAGTRRRTLTATGAKIGPVSLQFMLILGLTLVGLFYLVQSNRVSTASLELKSLETQKAQITEENERLQVEAARLQSIQTLKQQTDPDKKTAEASSQKAVAPIQSVNNVRPAT